MSKTPVTVYLDFRTARAIKARADALGVSQSRWLGDCAQGELERLAASPSALTKARHLRTDLTETQP